MESQTVNSVFDELEEHQPMNYATTGQRFANFLIDLLIAYAFTFVAGIILGAILLTGMSVGEMETYYASPGPQFLNILVSLVAGITAYTLIEGATKGKTLGKLITGTRAVQEDGGHITWKNAFIRSLCRYIPFEPFSALGGFPWHDRLSKTVVIKDNRK